MSEEIVLSVENLMMHFGGIKALNNVSLQVKRNSIFRVDRSQRRGQDHGVQLPDRILQSVRRAHRTQCPWCENRCHQNARGTVQGR